MLQELIRYNGDIQRLAEAGYAIAVDSSYLIVRDIPYLDNQKSLQIGAIVTKLLYVDRYRVVQEDHQVLFAGGVPCNADATPIPNLGGGATVLALSETSRDVVVQRSFSNKPRSAGRFTDFFEKVETYVTIISGPAVHMYGATPFTYRIVGDAPTDSVFRFHDTLTSRAEIIDLSDRLKKDVVALVGLGGTGAYLLDYLVRTPVLEIRIFDPDPFYVHNAFRSPGRLVESEFKRSKAELYQSRYDNFRTNVNGFPKFVDPSCVNDFDGVSFAFVCVDGGHSRAGIFDLLINKGIPFIDTGLGLARRGDRLNGMLRMTYYSVERGMEVRAKQLAEENEHKDELYRTNIQISELNALNAALAVIKYKQLRGFYAEDSPLYHLLFEVGDLKTVGESQPS